MSYGGHVLDMITRLKEGREPLKRRREQAKGKGRNSHIGRGNKPKNLTVEKFDEINKALKEREQQQKHYFNRMTIILTSAVVAGTILVCILVKIFIL